MSHYAKVLDGKVVQVKVADADYMSSFVDTSPGEWIETFEDGSQRGNYAGVGMIYDRENDVFYKESVYPSWTLNTDIWAYEPPVALPDDASDDNLYRWDEDTTSWVAK